MIAVFTLRQDFRRAGAEIHALRSLMSTDLVGRNKCGLWRLRQLVEWGEVVPQSETL